MNSKLSKAFNAFVKPSAALRNYSVISFFLLPASAIGQQAITGIVTDFNSFWKTSAASINPVKPNNSHNLLAFTFNGVQYSTGANNAVLNSNGQTYVEGDFWSLPLSNYSGSINSNTKVGLGEMYDGVHNGKGTTNYVNDISYYLNDGIKGLNIGTCVANLPAGTISFTVNNLKPSNIGDGIPDIIITQVADPSGSADRYSFVDANGTVIGQTKTVTFTSIPAIANWTADFYEASTNPMTLSSGFTNTDRPIRLWGADLSDFGITAANFSSIRNFRINLSGNSDVAFVAYNNRTMNISVTLPAEFKSFGVRENNGNAILNWATANEKDVDYFVVEKCMDGSSFTAIDTIKAKGNSTTIQQYSTQDAELRSGKTFYRLKIVDVNKHTSLSKTVQLEIKESNVRVFPNPAAEKITVSYNTSNTGNIRIYNTGGILMQQKKTERNTTQTTVDVSSYSKGIYYLIVENEREKTTRSFVVR